MKLYIDITHNPKHNSDNENIVINGLPVRGAFSVIQQHACLSICCALSKANTKLKLYLESIIINNTAASFLNLEQLLLNNFE